MSELLVSVRSVAEAEAALAGGAALIDVKEPAAGSLGRASDVVVAEVIRFVAGRRPVSAALGEVLETPAPISCEGVAFGKWGLAGCRDCRDWRTTLLDAGARLQAQTGCRPVAAAYADWRLVQAPPLADVCALACTHRWAAFLLDTGRKGGKTLLDHIAVPEIAALCRRCREAGVAVALAGSLGVEQIRSLLPLAPDWFAVRGAACTDGERAGTVNRERVSELARLLGRARPPATASEGPGHPGPSRPAVG